MDDGGDNGEDEHGYSNGDTGGDGVFFDVSYELVLDASGVRLESEDEARDADAESVKQTHFDRGVGVFNRDEDKENGKDGGVGVFAEEEGGGALEVVDGLTTFVDNGGDRSEIVV